MTTSAGTFIVGCGRSGTTLLRSMVDSHPAVAVPDESYFPVTLADRYRASFDADDYLRMLGEHHRFRNWGLPLEQVASRLNGVNDFPTAIRATFQAYADAHGADRWADKTPNFALKIPQLSKQFPDARFVHLIRDGRNVALSIAQGHFGPAQVPAAALYWAEIVERCRADGAQLGVVRYLEVKYEELVAMPETTLRRLCDFLDLPFSGEMLDYADRADRVLERTALSDVHKNLRQSPVTGIRDWRSEMDGRTADLVQHLIGSTLRDFGYSVDAGPATTSSRLRAVWVRAQHAFRRRVVTARARRHRRRVASS